MPLGARPSSCAVYGEGGTGTPSTVSSWGHVRHLLLSAARRAQAWECGGGISPGVSPEGGGDLTTAGTHRISSRLWLRLGSVHNYLPSAEETWGTWG